jgi:hypothetical protein
MLLLAAGFSLALVLAPPPRFQTFTAGQQRGAGDAGRRFLFYFRAKHGDMRLEEVRQVSSMLGYGVPSISPCLGEPGADEPVIASMGGDVGPSVFQWVCLPNAAAAEAVASRCVLVRTVIDVWASLDSPQGVSWEDLAARVDATTDDVRASMLSDLGTGSWRADILSFGRHKPYSTPQKVKLLKHWSKLLWAIPGPVDLDEPDQHIMFLEDYGALRCETAAQTKSRSPRRLFVGRRVCEGAGSLLHRYALSRRPFIGRTALPPDLAFLMANYAHVTRGSLVLDPFCGSASILLACAHFGADTVGVDLDARVLCAASSRPPGQTLPTQAQPLLVPTLAQALPTPMPSKELPLPTPAQALPQCTSAETLSLTTPAQPLPPGLAQALHPPMPAQALPTPTPVQPLPLLTPDQLLCPPKLAEALSPPAPTQPLLPSITSFPGIAANFAQAGLPPPLALVLGDAMGLLPLEPTRDTSMDASLDASADVSWDTSHDTSLDTSMGTSRDASMDTSHDTSHDVLNDASLDDSRDAARTAPLAAPLDPPLDSFDASDCSSLPAPLLPDAPDGRWRNLDAIVTDPPYGNMEGRGEAFVPLGERVAGLVAIASYRLRVGGRLVFLLPVPGGGRCPPLVRPGGCMRVAAVQRNPVSIRFDRLVVVLEKTKPATRPDYHVSAGALELYSESGAGCDQAEAQAGDLPSRREGDFATPWAGTPERRL